MRFNKFATPGDVLELTAERAADGDDGEVWFKGRAKVGDSGVCRLKFALRPVAAV